MDSLVDISIAPFRPEDQAEAKSLVLAGLVGHWGWLDPTKNPDLEDIAAAYADGLFLVARQDGALVGTGALLARSTEVAELVRMSVAVSLRRRGIGRSILHRLIVEAAARGFKRVVLETTQTWDEVVAFYLRNGFRLTHHAGGDAHFAFDLEPG